MRRVSCVLLALSVTSGCSAGWQRVELADTIFAPREAVQVWRGAKPLVLHAVSVTPDSLVGVPFQKPPSCDSCRVAMARRDVDSLRLGDPETAGIVSWAVPILVVVGLLTYWASRFKD